MNLFDVYNLWDIEPVRAEGCHVWDREGVEYLDFYGGHAVISIGHSHPLYVKAIQEQVARIGFYSNSVINSLQTELAEKLGEQSGYPDYALFLCNSGAEANENALKLASFHTGRKRIIACSGSFHGRTSGAVAVTDNPSIQSLFNSGHEVTFLPLNDVEGAISELAKGDVAAVMVEGIQGVAGIFVPEDNFLQQLEVACRKHGTVLVLDEIQSGYGRTGRFFAHQYAGIKPDMITVAKGMGNGFPIGGVLISPEIKAKKGMLGTTFGGNHLACAAAIAVLDVLKEESLIENAFQIGNYLLKELSTLNGIAEIRGRGLMLGVELKPSYSEVRNRLLFNSHIFTGGAKNNVMRLLPPLSVSKQEADTFLNELKQIIETY
ncbi:MULTISPECIES: aspartate aminotransferase family protein [Petrimonas]|jgi:acetylornithine/N-succinyldiaminopimelate aminotransferase|uniref:Acetylornithine aminotransferase n=1 Tax=Petrimonas mucosa TaxID=1642646 RepID=A0A1G4G4Z8_9BACT|nr:MULTISPECIES: aspartate aminotransferase family protein [Petrimonas]MDD3561557.1 aspartate aminotransferase family protein [Petrimonas mucosa]SCM56130.1 Acetylornithine aminotransferase {ECO:0000255/HAMAP-Rule:MF_01107} [Petrimonas mucosa]SFU54062.1 acetylornithine aminotransferase [Porphyromonadaceae bacterium KHP3R9]HHT30849.1 aspartate aminotransferase family protein [Petrimonas mucosa]